MTDRKKALEVSGLKVAHLNWYGDSEYCQGRGLGSHYDIYRDGKKWRVWLMHQSKCSYFKSISDAKNACQNEYDERVLCALIEQEGGE
ncbi:hypothetical protein [Thioclava sp. DLFJ4-1]|uniref:hypothetical protein n=1 Tax=Thioclava sp. DLFJ4-1 TaxID=1915313 RepID=UPI0009989C41|nr:hypothetical protein [Thioclava sp. DLFJ4-1]OOY15108.1 hypothetical protein BMI85_16305 [Thioclava sp. DLFJ4-1]